MMTNKLYFDRDEALLAPVFQQRLRAGTNNRQNPVALLPEMLFITSYPPRECGIATYSQDLRKALINQFSDSFSIKVCALESGPTDNAYPEEVQYTLDTTNPSGYSRLATQVSNNPHIEIVLMQHEFGFFEQAGDNVLLQFLKSISQPVVIVFHTVLPDPNAALMKKVRSIADACKSVIVMTKNAALILNDQYGVSHEKIAVIPHGTHLVPHLNKELLKEKHDLKGWQVLSTFGLLSSGKGIETTLRALPAIIALNPNVKFLIIGKTHPGAIKSEGEKYRNMLENMVAELKLKQHVEFINRYLPLNDLLEYLQLTDIYLFTSKDPNQAVSGTFSYAMSCGCPIISTPIPHAREVLRKNTGIIIDFESPGQMAKSVNRLLSDDDLRMAFSSSTLHRIVPSSWENAAIAHALLLQKIAQQTSRTATPLTTNMSRSIYHAAIDTEKIVLQYSMPEINLDHLKKMTTRFGMIQFAKINQPDIDSGYTLDDNARAMIAVAMHYEQTGDPEDLHYLQIYLNFIKFCQQPEGYFLNYVDDYQAFTPQNDATNLADSNGRAIWALGYIVSLNNVLPDAMVIEAMVVLECALPRIAMVYSTRAMAFIIKGLHYANKLKKSPVYTGLITRLANRLVQMFRHESSPEWPWYESYLTYANSILPEALLCAWTETGDPVYKEIAKSSFDFLLSLTFKANEIKVISNQSWLHKGKEAATHGEQPIDVAYSILALSEFYQVFQTEVYAQKMAIAFNWFLGNNHLHQIIYNPCTGGCYDGLEEKSVNLNQGAESTVSYLMARLTMQKHIRAAQPLSLITLS